MSTAPIISIVDTPGAYPGAGADAAFIAFEEARAFFPPRRTHLLGNPIRRAFLDNYLHTKTPDPHLSIVDDDESVRAAVSSLVRSLGYQSCVFSSAEEFLTSPQLNDTSCVIADVQMPGMNGMELQDALAVRRPHIPVIFITAFPEERIRKRTEAAGAIAFFGKPVNSHALIECLDAALRSS